MKHYFPTGRRNHGRHLKRLLDTWDRNGSTSDPTPLQIYDDYDIREHRKMALKKYKFISRNVLDTLCWSWIYELTSLLQKPQDLTRKTWWKILILLYNFSDLNFSIWQRFRWIGTKIAKVYVQCQLFNSILTKKTKKQKTSHHEMSRKPVPQFSDFHIGNETTLNVE